jgi:autotransporter-associated beta strand protein
MTADEVGRGILRIGTSMAPTNRSRDPSRRRPQLAVDRLEPRQMLAGDVEGFVGPLEVDPESAGPLPPVLAGSGLTAGGTLFPASLGLPDLQAKAVLQLHDQTASSTTLSNTVVTMTGKSELWITGSTNPVTGSTFQLDSADAWLFFPGIKPSVVNATILGQVRVGGLPAVHGSNARVVQYATGTVVIPHAPSFRPLEVFTGPNFTGEAVALEQYTYHDSPARLGTMHQAISSFRLARGYMATFATESNGSGRSRVYVAQDHDLDVSFLPGELDNAVQFVRVLPWRWVSKKGTSDLGADPLDAAWRYNWNNNLESTLDWEYVPIRQQRYWPSMPVSKTNVTHILGFNEPDNPVEDAYESLGRGSVDAAIAFWPQMLSTGLRVGSPAVTDGGKAWLYEFMDKAIAANLRVDYIAIHNYQANHTASSLSNWLKDIYDRYRLPIWVTEFNNGANWTAAPDPTLQQNADWVASITEMFDTTPWIERYSIYSNVEDVRKMIDSSGGLTPAGIVYRNNPSPIGYVQDLPAAAATSGRRVSRLAFEGDTTDGSGLGNNAQLVGAPEFVVGRQGQALRFDGTSTFLRLPANVVGGSSFSFAAWVHWEGGGNWQRIFDFGNGTSSYLFLTPSNGSSLRFGIRNGGSEQRVETAPLPVGQWTHVAITLGGGVARLYLNGSQVAVNASVTITPGGIDPTRNFLGDSQFAADPLFRGVLDEVLITDTPLTAAQVAGLAANQPPRFTAATITAATAVRGTPLAGNLTGQAVDPDGDPLVFAKASGPAWLTVAADGTYGGTLPASAAGIQEFVVTATDSKGSIGSTTLVVPVAEVYWRGDLNGVWTAASGGNTNWASDPAGAIDAGRLPDAATDAVFAAGSATNLPSVTLGGDVAVRGVRITSGSGVTLRGTSSLTLGAGGVELAAGGGASSILTTGQVVLAAPQTWVLANDFTVTSAITGAASLAKSGAGTLQLLGTNTATGGTSIGGGTLRIGNGGTTGSIVGDVVNNGQLLVDRSSELVLSGRISGTGSLTKWSGGRLVLGSPNTYSGGTTIGSDAGPGVLRATANAALGSGPVVIGPNGNGTTARLELAGDIALGNAVSLPLRNNATVAIQNVGGTNALTGTITLAVGGSSAVIQSDAGRLTVGGITSAAGGSRTVTLQGSGDGRIAGVVSNGTGTVGLTKTGLGTWTLSAANTYSGDTTIVAGTLALDGPNRIADGSALVLSGGTFSTGGFSETVARLSLLGDATLDLGAAASTVRAVTAGAFTAGRTLAIVNWTADADRVFIGSTAALTPAQLGQITINGRAVGQTATGEIVPLAPPDLIVTVGPGDSATAAAFAGDGRLIKRGEGTLVIDQPNSHSGGTIVEAGTVEIRALAALGSGRLEVRAGATVRLGIGLASVPLAGLDLALGAALDVGTGGLDIAAGGADEASLRSWVVAGRGGGDWRGSSGIRSSDAALAATSRTIGYEVRPDGSARLLFTAIGDLDLDRDVDAFDLIRMNAGGRYGTDQASSWSQGDVTYDGRATVFDLVGINSAGTYGAGSVQERPAAFATAAEPPPAESDLEAGRLVAFSQIAAGGWRDAADDDDDG